MRVVRNIDFVGGVNIAIKICNDTASISRYTIRYIVPSLNMNDKNDILNRKNAVCGKLNNLLCYFWKCDPFIKHNELYTSYYDLYTTYL